MSALDEVQPIPPPTLLLATPPAGPVLSGSRAPVRHLKQDTVVPLLTATDRVLIALFTGCWLVAYLVFWVWWLQPEHLVGWFGMIVNSVLLFYMTYLPSYFLLVVNRLSGVNPNLPIPEVRAAFAVTKAPSEPWQVAKRTLESMLTQRFPYPYDVWLCDESPSEETRAWCSDHGVHLSTRYGNAEYHQPDWPRRTKCKEGNLAYFYDQWGYENYDVVAQLDCDHVPAADYLAEMVRPFEDPAVGYVAAPSVCNSNADHSWSARGRLHREGTFHGPSQIGHNDGMAPVCIGSHYAVRTEALAQIGGVGPELAEDFSTSFLLSSAGWQGVFADRAEAFGEGPLTFSAMITQEFQWSRSLVTVFTNLFPRHVGRFSWKLRLRFLFALTYYPLLALTILAGLCLPVIAAVTGEPWVNINYVSFLLHWLAMPLWLILIVLVVRRRGLLRPKDTPLISWENYLYTLSRWPYIAWGVVAAVRNKLFPGPVSFKVTPKSRDGLEPLPTRLMLPYIAISLVTSVAALIGEFTTQTYGYVFLCLLASMSYAIVALAIPLLHAAESARANGVHRLTAIRFTVVGPLLIAGLTAVPLLVGVGLFPSYIAPLWGYTSPLFGGP